MHIKKKKRAENLGLLVPVDPFLPGYQFLVMSGSI
jgi:hypothetical protein